MSVRHFCAALLCVTSAGAPAADSESERDRIATERAAAAMKLNQQEQACQGQFVVTSCVDAARREQRATLAHLQRQQVLLDEAKRNEAAAARRQAIRDKADAQQTRASDAAPALQRESARQAPQPNPPGPKRSGDAGRAGRPGNSGPNADQRATEQRNEAKFEARVREVQSHREAVERRNAERAAQGKKSTPLPVPAGASAPP